MRLVQEFLEVPGQKTGPAKLTAYLLDPVSVAPDRQRPMVVIAPGGAYQWLSDREKEPVAMRFLAMGYHACVLEYSVAPNRFPVALRELALAVARVRDQAEDWHVDPASVLVCGFSAGGHLACSLGTFWHKPVSYEAIGRTDREVRPDGLILCYPVITSGEYAHAGSVVNLLGEAPQPELLRAVSLEGQVTERMPPVFLWHTVTDEAVPVENSLLLASALRRAGVNFEFHVYASGCHGLALANEETAGSTMRHRLEPGCQSWISLVQSWIENRSRREAY